MISVCLASYNGAKYIRAQINSILDQLGERDELIISDDSSTDETIEVIKSINDKRIILLESSNFHNPVLNFENALKKAGGDLIFLSDQDDIWLDNKVDVMTKYLKGYDVVISDCEVIADDGTIIYPSFHKFINARRGFLHNFIKNGYLGCCIAFRKEMLRFYLPFPEKIAMHDIWIGLISEIYANAVFIPDKLILYKRHSSNVTSKDLKSDNPYFYRFKYRMVLIFAVLKRCLEILLSDSLKSKAE